MSQPDDKGKQPGDLVYKDGVVWIWTGHAWRSGDSPEQRGEKQVDAVEDDQRPEPA